MEFKAIRDWKEQEKESCLKMNCRYTNSKKVNTQMKCIRKFECGKFGHCSTPQAQDKLEDETKGPTKRDFVIPMLRMPSLLSPSISSETRASKTNGDYNKSNRDGLEVLAQKRLHCSILSNICDQFQQENHFTQNDPCLELPMLPLGVSPGKNEDIDFKRPLSLTSRFENGSKINSCSQSNNESDISRTYDCDGTVNTSRTDSSRSSSVKLIPKMHRLGFPRQKFLRNHRYEYATYLHQKRKTESGVTKELEEIDIFPCDDKRDFQHCTLPFLFATPMKTPLHVNNEIMDSKYCNRSCYDASTQSRTSSQSQNCSGEPHSYSIDVNCDSEAYIYSTPDTGAKKVNGKNNSVMLRPYQRDVLLGPMMDLIGESETVTAPNELKLSALSLQIPTSTSHCLSPSFLPPEQGSSGSTTVASSIPSARSEKKLQL